MRLCIAHVCADTSQLPLLLADFLVCCLLLKRLFVQGKAHLWLGLVLFQYHEAIISHALTLSSRCSCCLLVTPVWESLVCCCGLR